MRRSVKFLFILSFLKSRGLLCQDVKHFPKDMIFGTATSAYQVEGAWNADGKSENIFDHLIHNVHCFTDDCSSGDVASNSYYNYKRDVQMIRELGLDFYRFSISWTRILPTGFPDVINKAGVQYYNNLINELLKYNIKPLVTIYHWDLPQKLQDMGGWTNPYIVDWFGDYARVLFDLFGDRVKNWITINEPLQICYFGYGDTRLAPAVNIKGVAEYLCNKNVLMAHARAYHLYDKVYRAKYKGTIFITINAEWYEPENESNFEAADDTNQFMWGMYTHPIFSVTGDFPPAVKDRINTKSLKQGFSRSRLPSFTPEEMKYVRGTSDVLGLNHYASFFSYRNASTVNKYASPSFANDIGAESYQLQEWRLNESKLSTYTPWGFYKLLTYLRKTYNNIPVFVTENGIASVGGLNDDDRVTYYRDYLNAMLDAIEEGSKIVGYTAWSLMDNFEWKNGFTQCYGIYEVDYNDPNRTRTPRKSAYVLKEIVRTRSLDVNYDPDISVPITIDKGH